DFHLGSGTTAAVAHKMGRRYIGVEQMDYIETVSVERLKKVISGEQGGISKSVLWQGGGSFVYLELAKANQHLVEQIFEAKNESTLSVIWEKMQEKAFISHRIDLNKGNFYKAEFESLNFAKICFMFRFAIWKTRILA
ncbi:MAG: site-specific DNA-methyltransferase, partial [Bacteroidetes bacterium]